jgi:Zn-dependent peptidase ImmA (M78 family)
LSVNVLPDELRRVALHELQHAAAAKAGLYERLSTPELEDRATVFAAKVMGWR